MLPLSFIAEYAYCPRSAYYLFVDAPKSRDENQYIQSGRSVHQKSDAGYQASKSGKRVETAVRVFSRKFQISGKIDILEFYPNDEIMPVEIKRGRVRENYMHEIQLALMTMCLQENFPNKIINHAAIFFAQDRQRKEISMTTVLLKNAGLIVRELRDKINRGLYPKDFPMKKDARCIGCCFHNLCYI